MMEVETNVSSSGVYRPTSKKFSRNKKKNWRKFLDTKDVDQARENRHNDLLAGKEHVSQQEDEELFSIDTQADKTPASLKMTRKEYRESKKMLWCEKAVLPNEYTTSVYGRKTKLASNISKTKSKAESLPAAAAGKKPAKEGKASTSSKGNPTRDIWNVSDKMDMPIFANEFEKELYRESTRRVRKPNSYDPVQSKSISRVEVAHPGQSYNPSLSDHRDALKKSANMILSEDRYTDSINKKFGHGVTMKKMLSYDTYAKEMALNFDDTDDDEVYSQDDDSGDVLVSNKQKSRKTRQTRTRHAKEMEFQKQIRERKEQNRRMNEVYRLKAIGQEIAEEQAESTNRKSQRLALKLKNEVRPVKIGRYGFREEALQVQLGEELCGNLRSVTPTNDGLRDRFRSLQKRNIIEVRKKFRRKRRYKLKQYEKRSFKNRSHE